MPSTQPLPWPVLKRYDRDHLARIAMPLGGIGTGTISLGGRGDLRDWEVGHAPAKGFRPGTSLFAVWMKSPDSPPITRLLEGPLPEMSYEGSSGATAPNHGWPRFRNCEFHAAYPLAQVLLSDPDLPLSVRIEAFNPLVPGDADTSGIPLAILRFVLTNTTDKPLSASVCGAVENFIGVALKQDKPKRNVNELRNGGGSPIKGLFLRAPNVDPRHEQWGTFAIATLKSDDITHRTSWAKLSWGDSLLDFYDDFSADGKLDERNAEDLDHPIASLASLVDIPPRQSRSVTFLLAWHFPNRIAWTGNPPERIGNYYSTTWWDAWDIIEKTAPRLPELERKTVAFVRAFCEADLPEVAKEAALFNLSTLRTQTCFRSEDGRFFGWEGCNDHGGCCHGSCTHVWNYEQATAFTFGELARSMRETEFGKATNDRGLMSFRVNLPIAHAQEFNRAAADGQMGTIMRLYRDWRLSGDDDMLKRSWPPAKRAMEFAWIPGGWDADKDGVMEGCQHNTMDVEYYGANPEMGSWYLGALRACEEMAKKIGDTAFAATCHDLFTRGSKWMDENLFNGEYYEHHIQPAKGPIAEGLSVGMGGSKEEPVLQLGPGCLADQLVGQYVAHVCGLGHLLDPAKVKTTLASIMKHNFREGFFGHFNHLRSYALGDESGLLIATYPRGNRPKRPFPYCNEVWTGLEYTAAAGMIYEGLTDEGLKAIAAARLRHDGRKRNPFDEPECGHHYARAMAAWAAILALTGFQYDASKKSMSFAPMKSPGTWFWSNGQTWGTIRQQPTGNAVAATLTVMGAPLAIRELSITGIGAARVEQGRIDAGTSLSLTIRA